MSTSANNNPKAPKGFRPNKLTAILGGIIVIIAILLGILISKIPSEQQPINTTPPTTELSTETPTEVDTEPSEPLETIEIPTVEVSGGMLGSQEMLPEMAELYKQNGDTFGWLKIDDTVIDYPVMYTPDDPNKYMYMSFEGKYKYRGELFVETDCNIVPEGTVIMIHGHNMNDGSMFQSLLNYKSQKYWENHPTISFKTLYEERTYEIFAAFRDQVPDSFADEKPGVFYYYHFLNPATEEEFNEGISYFKEKTAYDMGIDVEFGDRLIMLSTCDRSINNGRFVVVGRLVTEDEPVNTP